MTDMFHLKAIEIISRSLRSAVANENCRLPCRDTGQHPSGLSGSEKPQSPSARISPAGRRKSHRSARRRRCCRRWIRPSQHRWRIPGRYCPSQTSRSGRDTPCRPHRRYHQAGWSLPRQQEVFNLSRNAHLTYKEISIRLNISEKTVERHINEALKFLKKNIMFYLIFIF